MAGPFTDFSLAVKHRWRTVTGNPFDFSLEARIFHSISIGIAILMFAYMVYDLLAGLYIAALSCIVFGAIFFFEYYRSRFLLRPHRSLVFGISGLLILSVNYFANAGIQGSTDLIWPAYLLLLLTICPYRQMVTWVIIYLVAFILVHLLEKYVPHLVQFPFSAGKGQFTDRITAFPLPVIGMAIIIALFRRNYDRERAAVAQRDAEKGRLLSILSHDLRSPFIQVQQYIELLNNNALSPEERSRIENALKQTNDLTLNLVTNLLYWSRSQMEGFTIRPGALPLLQTLESTLEIAKELSQGKHITFTTEIDPDISVIADADMLQLAVRNLLQNAIKFTAPGGAISLKAAILANRCCISVEDNGIGMKPEQVAALFSGIKPSFGTANEKGIGLGLQLCKEFIERQGGSIAVESEWGKGSRFMLYIPLANENEEL